MSSDHPSPSAPVRKRKRASLSPPLSPIRISRPKPESKDSETSSSSDDDAIGPSLPIAGSDHERAIHLAISDEPAKGQTPSDFSLQAKKPERESWMLVPPTDDSLGFMSDPSKLKNRRFQTQPSNKCDKQAKGAAVDRSWTEAPAEKIARLKREALGAMGPAADPSASNRRKTSASERSNEFGLAGGSEQQQRQRKRVRDQETRQKIEDFNSHQSRGEALYEQSNKKGQRVEEDDPSKRAFDREKDVVGKSISGMQKKDFVKRAAAFGSRFSGGKYL